MRVRSIFWSWLPLAISFELMMLEGPAVQRAIGSLANPIRNLAAFGLTFQLSLLIESPVIMLLATAIALVRDSQSHRALRRFTLNLAALCTGLTLLIAFTPLYTILARTIMHQPADVAAAARPALQIMLLWSAAIGWRRFYQGILVRYGQTRLISLGTFIRLGAIVVVAWALARHGGISGARVGAFAVMAGVIAEAVITSAYALPMTCRLLLPRGPAIHPELSQRAILRFHTPLAVTTVLTLLVGPLSSAALAVLTNPRPMLAACQIAVSLLMVMRGWGFAIQEIAVALAPRAESRPALARFTWLIGGISSGATILVVLTPLLSIYLRYVVHAPEDLTLFVRSGVAAGIALPLLTSLTSWRRGLLVAAGRTSIIYRGMGANLCTHAAILTIGVALHLPGMVLVFGSVSLATLMELLFLTRQSRERAVDAHQAPITALEPAVAATD